MTDEATNEKQSASGAYWALVAVLVVFGFLGAFTIGAPFLLVGITLAVLYPVLDRPRVFWPVLLAVIGFFVGFALLAPLSCTQQAFTDVESGQTVNSGVVCRSLIGITYTGSEDPSVLPGLIAGLVVAAVLAIVAWFVAGRRETAVE